MWRNLVKSSAWATALEWGTASEKLAALLADESMLRLNQAESAKKLRSTVSGLVRVQREIRKWQRRLRMQREQYKVLTRTSLLYTSHMPAARRKQVQDMRDTRVNEHGWRAPLIKKYAPLGEPKLVLDRKPEWAGREAEAAALQAAATGRDAAIIGHGESVRGSVKKFGLIYFQTFMFDAKARLIVTATADTGDPDLFMSRSNQRPDQVHHTWSSIGVGSDRLEVLPSDASFGLGQYYIGVYGGGSAAETSFTLAVKVERLLSFDLHGMSAATKRHHLAASSKLLSACAEADARRKRVVSGASATALVAEAHALIETSSPQYRLHALRELPRVVSANGSANGGGAALGEPELSARLHATLAARLQLALGTSKEGGQGGVAVSAEWLCHVIAHLSSWIRLGQQAPLLLSGEPASFVAFVLKGELQGMLEDEEAAVGAQRMRHLPGDLIGDERLLGRGSQRGHSVVATAPCELALVHVHALRLLLDMELDTAEALCKLVAVCSPAFAHLAEAADEDARGATGAKHRAKQRQAQAAMFASADAIEMQLRDIDTDVEEAPFGYAFAGGAPVAADELGADELAFRLPSSSSSSVERRRRGEALPAQGGRSSLRTNSPLVPLTPGGRSSLRTCSMGSATASAVVAAAPEQAAEAVPEGPATPGPATPVTADTAAKRRSLAEAQSRSTLQPSVSMPSLSRAKGQRHHAGEATSGVLLPHSELPTELEFRRPGPFGSQHHLRSPQKNHSASTPGLLVGGLVSSPGGTSAARACGAGQKVGSRPPGSRKTCAWRQTSSLSESQSAAALGSAASAPGANAWRPLSGDGFVSGQPVVSSPKLDATVAPLSQRSDAAALGGSAGRTAADTLSLAELQWLREEGAVEVRPKSAAQAFFLRRDELREGRRQAHAATRREAAPAAPSPGGGWEGAKKPVHAYYDALNNVIEAARGSSGRPSALCIKSASAEGLQRRALLAQPKGLRPQTAPCAFTTAASQPSRAAATHRKGAALQPVRERGEPEGSKGKSPKSHRGSPRTASHDTAKRSLVVAHRETFDASKSPPKERREHSKPLSLRRAAEQRARLGQIAGSFEHAKLDRGRLLRDELDQIAESRSAAFRNKFSKLDTYHIGRPGSEFVNSDPRLFMNKVRKSTKRDLEEGQKLVAFGSPPKRHID